ncbi:PTS system fructose-specific IIC component [Trichococcus patagoniensis]|uniref:PTS system fructose-specific IIC component n=1 Tax=Trichococcus patagoniensis TaxID=382641 RepID=A0A2T5IJM3_9LACT|nr:PTS fructose transporter subunit IIC [Trichococcus patagoniensis]PTQ84028.1 PTS system fructose-specific IIC component [Trichococcus patagoniensis]
MKIRRALMTGVSYMLPFIVFSGMTIALTGMYSQYIQADNATILALNGFAWTMMNLIPAIFAAYVSYAIADKPGLAPGFIGGYIASMPPVEGTASSGFLGGMIAGLVAGYLVLAIKKFRWPDFIEPIKKTLFIPVIAGLALYFLMAYPVAMSVGVLNEWIIKGLIQLSQMPQYAFLLGALLSAMCAFDMGGPIGKIAITFVFAVWNEPSGIGFIANAAVFPGIMVPALSVGIAALIARSKYTLAEQKMAPASILSGFVGITETAIPYAIQDPFRIIPANMIGAAIGGAIMMGFGVSTSGVSGVFGMPMASNLPIFLLAILVGVAVSVTLQVLLKKPVDIHAIPEETYEEFDIDIT